MEQRRGLGRGLAALLEDVDDQSAASARTADSATPAGSGAFVAIDLIRRNPDQPRQSFNEAELDALTDSIREKGVLQPILVRPAPGVDGAFQIVAGERRWRASQRAGLTEVPVTIRVLDDLEVLEIAVVENVQRADLNPIEEAQGYRSLIERFGRTQEAIAKAVGKSRSHVANALRLLSLPDSVREHLASDRLSVGHARAIAAAPDPSSLAERILAKGLNVRQAEALARQAAPDQPHAPRGNRPATPTKNADTAALEQDLEDLLGLTVSIHDREGKGELRVSYETLEQLDDICRRLSQPA